MVFFSDGNENEKLEGERISELLDGMLDKLGNLNRILIIPPDITRYHSYAGEITRILYRKLKKTSYVEIMPALGTHMPLTEDEMDLMYHGIPKEIFKKHDWKNDIIEIGTIRTEVVKELTGALVDFPIRCEINKTLIEGNWDQIISIGQLMPHELIGIANHNKNIFVGVGGKDIIDKSHFIGALYGAEEIMGHVDSPVRRVLDYMAANFTKHLPISYILTVRGFDENKQLVTRGIYAGNDKECYLQGAELCKKVNIKLVEKEYKKVVAYLDPGEYKSTWTGNKALQRTRMMIADGGELLILAPGISVFSEDSENDAIMRKYGYRNKASLLKAVRGNDDLANNLAAASALIVGSTENRFRVTYAVKKMTREEVESVNYDYADYEETVKKYDPFVLKAGINLLPDGEEVFFVPQPALGLWAEYNRYSKNDKRD